MSTKTILKKEIVSKWINKVHCPDVRTLMLKTEAHK